LVDQARRKPGSRSVLLPSGEARISVVDGYRLIYSASGPAPFVNLKVERSQHDRLRTDAELALASLLSEKTDETDYHQLEYDGTPYFLLVDSDFTCDCGTLGTALLVIREHDLIVTAYFLNYGLDELGFSSREELAASLRSFIPAFLDATSS
jgi:hypothetical protein